MSVATTRRLVAAAWGADNGDVLEEHVIEVERTDRDEIGLCIRGFGSSTSDLGTLYLTDDSAVALQKALAEAVKSR